ncbi:hypothetical protein, conserved [Babesia bigemina]|uniref:Uncharacterized protein n=1 Tax=Babesia bigemina TaxID=5866 RepID=A0A061DDV3_BABBI|nr:hypothetical protein, conserved [Babesia bigemina]CDR97719.1 hypothetical protein, conserved [Babesia bigemina]|eukprot:XP_012769905.1 hypothetical protein, conserved [Babesia bigemina]
MDQQRSSSNNEHNTEGGGAEVGYLDGGTHRAQVVLQYARQITQSLKSAVLYAVNTGKQANDSLAELQSQNENISRIKAQLTESHKTVSATQKIVDAYVNSVRWISSSIAWQRPADVPEAQPASDGVALTYNIRNLWSSLASRSADAGEASNCIGQVSSERDPVKSALVEFSSTANEHLDVLIEELKSNRQKTELIAETVHRQNEELERIGESAVSLQDRVAQVNRVLRDHT